MSGYSRDRKRPIGRNGEIGFTSSSAASKIAKKTHPTETITFRLPSALLEELRKDAELEKINLNAFVTRIFTNHVQWERYERKMGLLPMTKPFLKEVINQLTNDQIMNLAQKIEKENFKNILIFMNESHDVDDFVEILRTWLTVSWMQHNIVLRNGTYHFNIQHDLGYKWSLYVQTLVSELSTDILQRRAEIKITDNVIYIVFPRD
ncbi:MAG: hypothetical protein WCF07_00595 [Nitrososphaeraceae archaeon]